jgi:hypothetical protein
LSIIFYSSVNPNRNFIYGKHFNYPPFGSRRFTEVKSALAQRLGRGRSVDYLVPHNKCANNNSVTHCGNHNSSAIENSRPVNYSELYFAEPPTAQGYPAHIANATPLRNINVCQFEEELSLTG